MASLYYNFLKNQFLTGTIDEKKLKSYISDKITKDEFKEIKKLPKIV